MSKIVLFFVGLALLVVSGYYFFLVNSPSIVAKSKNRTAEIPSQKQSVLPVKNAFAGNTKTPPVKPEPVAVPEKLVPPKPVTLKSIQKTVPAVISLPKPVTQPEVIPTPKAEPIPESNPVKLEVVPAQEPVLDKTPVSAVKPALEKALALSVESALEEIVPKAKKVNVADSLRFALEGVVEESIEAELWDEDDSDTGTPQ